MLSFDSRDYTSFKLITIIIIIMYIYHALINALSAHMIHINLNMILYTHVEHSPTKTIYMKYYITLKRVLLFLASPGGLPSASHF